MARAGSQSHLPSRRSFLDRLHSVRSRLPTAEHPLGRTFLSYEAWLLW
jgi:hypothetical protein